MAHAPKFPAPHNILFLLRYWRRTGDDQTLEMVEATLQAMRMGGIYDHVGFGFHRYSTDAEWSLPHFEKMLYDQALLAIAYTEGLSGHGQRGIRQNCTRDPGVCSERYDSLLKEAFIPQKMPTAREKKGKFYSWTAEELKEVLDKEDFKLLIRLYDVHERGNFEKGRNILRQRSAFSDAAMILKMPESELNDSWNRIRQSSFRRENREFTP